MPHKTQAYQESQTYQEPTNVGSQAQKTGFNENIKGKILPHHHQQVQ